jgi:ABC-type glycerol-3-phosphate transport system substrate-binding protein
VEWGKYNEKVMTMLLGKRPPDVARMSIQWCKRYQLLGAFADISHWISTDDRRDFVSARLASCLSENQLFGLPHTTVGLMIYYNKTLFRDAGIEAPASPETTWSWEEFSNAGKTVQQKTGTKYGWGAFRGWFPFLTFIYQNDGYIVKENSPDFNNINNLEALEWFIQQHKTGISPKSSWSHGGDSAETLFLRGDSAMVLTGNWRLTTYSQRIKDFEWDVTYLPHGKRRATNLGGENLVVFNTPKKEGAAKLVKFITGNTQMEKFCTQTMFLPTRKSLLDKELPYKIQHQAMKKFALQSKDFEEEWASEQSTAEFAMIEDVFLKQIELAVLGYQTPKESLEMLNQEYRSVSFE